MKYIFFYSLLLVVYHRASAQNDSVKDIDGNVYKTVKIGTQVWMAENLKTAHYRDGTPIKEIEIKSKWANAFQVKAGAWCYYHNDSMNNIPYCKLYNWYAVANTHHLCPTGWHVPADSEWTVLTDYLGGNQIAGDKMKDTTLWMTSNTGADNSSGFTVLPAGYCGRGGVFNDLGYGAYFWSSAEDSSKFAWFCIFSYKAPHVLRTSDYKENGLSVRCVGD